ncbi:MAG: hypothetical protein KJO64_09095, partial [Bacteroidia bacterium]|nr:hypothetical protein [Bacteroidia bacterium]
SSWYTFTAQTTGTLSMTIAPANGTDDYDFAIWGPFSPCAPNSTPARCSYAAGGGNTGMQAGSGDVTEDAFGDRWVDDMVITAGENYVMLIDNWSTTTSPFSLTWTGTSSLDCAVVLPIELVYFKAFNNDGVNSIHWMTATEVNNDFFTLERSNNGTDFEIIAIMQGAGNSNSPITYSYEDRTFDAGTNYYRLTQTDFDGTSESFDVIDIDNATAQASKVIKVLNIYGQEVDLNYIGLKFIIYDNGEVVKRVGK